MLRWKEIYEIWRRESSLKQALNDSHTMLERTGRMFHESVKSLRESDQGEIEIDIYEEDQVVNRYQQDVRRKVLRHLAITGGVNVVPGLILTSIVVDIERIGDYTKNITELAVAHPKKLRAGKYEEDVARIESVVASIFDEIVPVLKNTDQEAARRLLSDPVWIRKRCDQIDLELIQGQDPSLGAGDAVAVALYVRYLKRIASHLSNILSSVVNPFERIGYREGT
jgi:phosphate transport system protein